MSSSRRYPPRPIVGVGALIYETGRVLLIQRGNEPLKGWWSLPGGAIELGEKAEAALLREVLEETGLELKIDRLAEVFDRVLYDEEGQVEYHYVVIDWICSRAGGEMHAGSDASDVRWFCREDLTEVQLTSGTLEVILKHWVD